MLSTSQGAEPPATFDKLLFDSLLFLVMMEWEGLERVDGFGSNEFQNRRLNRNFSQNLPVKVQIAPFDMEIFYPALGGFLCGRLVLDAPWLFRSRARGVD